MFLQNSVNKGENNNIIQYTQKKVLSRFLYFVINISD